MKTSAEIYRESATESEIQSAIVDALRWDRIIVLVTSRQWRRCPECGSTKRKGDGVTKGLADLMVRRPGWPVGVYLALEVKDATGKLSEDQMRLYREGALFVVRSVEGAQGAVSFADRLLLPLGPLGHGTGIDR